VRDLCGSGFTREEAGPAGHYPWAFTVSSERLSLIIPVFAALPAFLAKTMRGLLAYPQV